VGWIGFGLVAARPANLCGPGRLTAIAGAAIKDTMRSPFVSGTVLVVLTGIAAVGLKAVGAEPYSLAWPGALIVVMVLTSLTDPVRFGWREPDERRRRRRTG